MLYPNTQLNLPRYQNRAIEQTKTNRPEPLTRVFRFGLIHFKDAAHPLCTI
jgi:hypothetical protein